MGKVEVAHSFLSQFLKDTDGMLPGVIVIDLGNNKQQGWFILEFNACWGAGLNNCDAKKGIDCNVSATVTNVKLTNSLIDG